MALNVQIDIENGSAGEKIAAVIDKGLQMTSTEGLTNAANNIQGKVNTLATGLMDSPEKITEMATDMMMGMLSDTGAMDVINQSVNAATLIVQTLQKALQYAEVGVDVFSNITDFCQTADSDISCVPSVKESSKLLPMKFKDIIMSAYYNAKQQLIDLYNSMICTSNDAVLDNAIASINGILNVIEPICDPLLRKYTGYTVSEVRFTCNQGFALVSMLKRVSQENKQQKEAKKKVDNENSDQIEIDKAQQLADNMKIKAEEAAQKAQKAVEDLAKATTETAKKKAEEIKQKAEAEANKLKKQAAQAADEAKRKVEEHLEKVKQQTRAAAEDTKKVAKEQWEKLSQDYSKEKIKEKLLEWLKTQSIILQNAFNILLIKDMIADIKDSCQKLQNMSVENMADLCNMLQAVLDLFALLGLTPDAKGITLGDLKALGMGTVGMITQTAKSVSGQITNNAQNVLQVNIAAGQNIVGESLEKSKAAVNAANSLVKDASQQVIDFSNDIQNSYNQTISDTTNQLSNISDISINTENITNIANSIKDIQVDTQYAGEPFIFEIIQDETTNIVNVTLYDDPNKNNNISKYIDNTFITQKKKIFSNGVKKVIITKINDAWDADTNITFDIQGKVEKLSRIYTFNIILDKTSYNKYKNDEQQRQQNINNLSDKLSGQVGKLELSGFNNNINDVAGQTSSLINNTTNNIGNNVSNIAGDAVSLGSNAANTLIQQGTQSIDMLTNVNVNLDTTAIESVLQGKVMMFDEIIQILKIFQPVIQAIQILFHLLENYQINKATVENKVHKNLAESLRKAAETVIGLKDVIDLKTTNFFPIRTEKTYKWCKDKFNIDFNDAGIATINIFETTVLNTYCYSQHIIPENPLLLTLGTTLYYEKDNSNNFKDGTTAGLDKIQVNYELNEVYYDSKNRSTISSEILRAVKKGENPFYSEITDTIDEQKSTIDNILNSITVESDEFEGTQAINLQSMDLCEPPQILNTPVDQTNKRLAIVEFGDVYTMGEKVDYELNVKPGETISDKSILAYIKKGKNTIPVRSIFSGTIKETTDNNFYHVYPGTCTRHIIIEDAEPGQGNDFDSNDVSQFTRDMADSAELASLIMNNMCYSSLPNMLSSGPRFLISTVGASWDSYLDGINKIIEKAQKDTFNEDNISKLINDSSTSPSKMEESGNSLLSAREQMLQNIIDYYNKQNWHGYIGDFLYLDCVGLATSPNYDYHIKNDYKEKVGLSAFDNYYMQLLLNTDAQSECKFIQEYRNLLIEIIDNRLTTENYSLYDLMVQFNKLYKDNIDKTENSGYNVLFNIFNGDKATYDNIKEYLQRRKTFEMVPATLNEDKSVKISANAKRNNLLELNKQKQLTTDPDILEKIDSSISAWYSEASNDIMTADNYDNAVYIGVCQQLANLFMFIKSKCKESIPAKYTSMVNANNITLTNIKNTLDNLFTEIISSDKNLIQNKLPHEYLLQKYSEIYDIYKKGKNIKITSINDVNEKYIDLLKSLSNNKFDNLSDDEILIVNELFDKFVELTYSLYVKDVILSDETEKFIENRKSFELVKKEANMLQSYWEKMINLYYGDYSLNNIINNIKNYADNLNSFAKWPSPVDLPIAKAQYKLYTFVNTNIEKAEMPEIKVDLRNTTAPGKPTLDYSQIADINQPKIGDITILDYEYWLVYFLNATLVTLLPVYWADGFDVPPVMTPTKLPAIYIPIAPPVMIPFINLLVVFGIAIRGIWPMPIILMVNASSQPINVLTPVMFALESTKSIFQASMSFLENGIPNIIEKMINGFASESEGLKKQLDKYRVWAQLIHSIPQQDKALIEKAFKDAAHGENAYDNRQIVTRLDKLDNGPEPL